MHHEGHFLLSTAESDRYVSNGAIQSACAVCWMKGVGGGVGGHRSRPPDQEAQTEASGNCGSHSPTPHQISPPGNATYLPPAPLRAHTINCEPSMLSTGNWQHATAKCFLMMVYYKSFLSMSDCSLQSTSLDNLRWALGQVT